MSEFEDKCKTVIDIYASLNLKDRVRLYKEIAKYQSSHHRCLFQENCRFCSKMRLTFCVTCKKVLDLRRKGSCDDDTIPLCKFTCIECYRTMHKCLECRPVENRVTGINTIVAYGKEQMKYRDVSGVYDRKSCVCRECGLRRGVPPPTLSSYMFEGGTMDNPWYEDKV